MLQTLMPGAAPGRAQARRPCGPGFGYATGFDAGLKSKKHEQMVIFDYYLRLPHV